MIAVVDYGVGNLRSAAKGLERAAGESGCDADVRITGDANEIARASAVVLPGVGAFGACMDHLRAAGLVGTLQYGLKMTEHEHQGVKLVAYRVPEGKPLAEDPDGIRFNFEPCFAVVGDEFVLATTVELGKKLITELKKPQSGKSHSAVLRGRLSAKAGADAIAGFTDPLVTDSVLGRGATLAEARKEVADLVAFVRTLGTATVELDVTDKEYRVDVVWAIKN